MIIKSLLLNMNSILKPISFLKLLNERDNIFKMRRDIIRGWKIMLSNLVI